jgi:hypothetical protein
LDLRDFRGPISISVLRWFLVLVLVSRVRSCLTITVPFPPATYFSLQSFSVMGLIYLLFIEIKPFIEEHRCSIADLLSMKPGFLDRDVYICYQTPVF